MDIKNISTLKIHKLTQEQYDREEAAGRLEDDAIYLTPDEPIDLSAYVTEDQLNTELNKKSDTNHNHNDVYYTETEVDNLISKINWFGKGTAISTGDDLDTYTTDGKYYGVTSATKIINNCPVANDSFVLYVFTRQSSAKFQMIITLNSALYIRGSNTSGVFRAWQEKANASALENLEAELTELINSKTDTTYVDNAIANIPAITNAEIDAICNATIYAGSEVLV